jgi:uncharacterized membrane protein
MKKTIIVLLSITAAALLIFSVIQANHSNNTVEKVQWGKIVASKATDNNSNNYTIKKCLKRFQSTQAFLDLIQTGPNVTDETRVLASKSGSLMTGDKIWDSKIGEINPETDPKSATVKEIRQALEARENTSKSTE